jgi:hypothetical protein
MSVVENAKEQLLSSGSWFVDPAHSDSRNRVLEHGDGLVGDTVDFVLDVVAVRVG